MSLFYTDIKKIFVKKFITVTVSGLGRVPTGTIYHTRTPAYITQSAGLCRVRVRQNIKILYVLRTEYKVYTWGWAEEGLFFFNLRQNPFLESSAAVMSYNGDGDRGEISRRLRRA